MARKRKEEKKIPTALELMSSYMDAVVTHYEESLTEETFLSLLGPDNSFFQHFESLEAIEKAIWSHIITESINTVEQDEVSLRAEFNDKILSLFFTFFQNIGLNHEYFKRHLSIRKNIVDKNRLYSDMKKIFNNYVETIYQIDCMNALSGKSASVEKILNQGILLTYWSELVLLIEFWQNDTSEEFQKTDVAIDKALHATKELRSMAPLRSVIDLGYFLWKERFGVK